MTMVIASIAREADTARKFRFWSLLVVALFAIKGIVIAVILPARPMVPDEGLYVVVVESLVRGEDIIQAGNALGYGPIIFTGSWVLLRPAEFLTSLGVDQLASLRLTSLLLSSLASLLVLAIIFRARDGGISVRSVPGLAILTLLFLPSYQLWSVLALRDSSTALCMVVAAWGLSLLVVRPTRMSRTLGVIAIFLGTAGIYMARSYLALMLSGALLLAIALPPYRPTARERLPSSWWALRW